MFELSFISKSAITSVDFSYFEFKDKLCIKGILMLPKCTLTIEIIIFELSFILKSAITYVDFSYRDKLHKKNLYAT